MTRQNSFYVLCAKVRRERLDHLARLSSTLTFASRRFLELELTVEHCRLTLNRRAQRSNKKFLTVLWSDLPRSCPDLGPSKLRFQERVSGTVKRREIKRLTAAKLASLSHPDFLPFQSAAWEELVRVERERQEFRRAFATLMKAINFTSFSPEFEFSSALNKAALHREYMISALKAALADGGRRLDDLDLEMDRLIRSFNVATFKPNGSVMCRFELDGRTMERYVGPRGPSFFSMFPNPHTGKRFIRRVDHSQKRNQVPITVDLLRAAGYWKHAEEIITLAQNIIELRSHRDAIVDKIASIAKGLRLITKLEVQS